jgi:hypothetical protein
LGSADACEGFLLKAGDVLGTVFKEVFTKGAKESKSTKGPALVRGGGEADNTSIVLHADPDAESHEEKMSRWIGVAVKALNSKEFWINLVLAHVSREPLTHMMRFLQTKSKKGDLPKSLQLVFQKSSQLALEFDRLLDDEAILTSWVHLWLHCATNNVLTETVAPIVQ